jgi:hypothetical protein
MIGELDLDDMSKTFFLAGIFGVEVDGVMIRLTMMGCDMGVNG